MIEELTERRNTLLAECVQRQRALEARMEAFEAEQSWILQEHRRLANIRIDAERLTAAIDVLKKS